LNQHQAIDALKLYSELRPNDAVPEVLTAAYQRAKDMAQPEAADASKPTFHFGGGAPAAAQVASTDGVGVAQQALTSSSNPTNFVDSYGGCDWSNRFSLCRINWGGGFNAWASPAGSATCIVDHYAGNGITVQLTAGSTVLPTYQAPGTVQTYSWGIVGGNILRRIDLLNASGDAFHAGCRFFN